MGKAAAAAASAVLAGFITYAGLAEWLPVAWAEGGALLLTGAAMLGASVLLEAKPATNTQAAPLAPARQPQEA
jgi:hypothetical protein